MTIRFASNEKVAETSSKGNQEKWLDHGRWYKLDQFGYEGLSETAISSFLERSNIEYDTPFTFTRYQMERMNVHGRVRNGCSSESFLEDGASIITLSHLFKRYENRALKDTLAGLSSDKKRIAYLADATAEYTGLQEFPRYLTLLFEVDALFLNDDRHLNNIAVIQKNGKFSYCPIFDNGAGLLSNVQMLPMDIEPMALIKTQVARPFHTTFTRQMNTARTLYGKQLQMPRLTRQDVLETIAPFLEYYAQRDRGYIADRVCDTILHRQKYL